jgi:hypothetical protein
MADLKISALTASTTPLAGTEVLPIVQSGTTVKVSIDNLTTGKTVPTGKIQASSTGEIVKLTTSGDVTTTGTDFIRFYDSVGAKGFVGYAGTAARFDVNSGTSCNLNLNAVAGSLTLQAANTTRLTIAVADVTVNTGNLVIGTSGKGIDFSATPGTGTSELLADYEEGTWTVTDASGAGLTLVTATGFYTKIGRVVYWQANVDYPVTANASSALLGGLPFTISEGASPGRSGSFITATSVVSLVQTLQITPTNIRLYKTGLVRATNAELSGSTIYLAGFYVV